MAPNKGPKMKSIHYLRAQGLRKAILGVEGVVIAIVASRLMNAGAWNEIPLVVSCTLVPRERMSAIVKAHENIRGAWKENE